MLRPRPQPGGDPNRYYPFGGPYRGVSRGSKGQHVLSAHGFEFAGEFPDAPSNGGVLLLDWLDGDGVTPTVWGGAALTAAGAPTAGGRTLPWETRHGVRLAQTLFANNQNYTSADTRLDPAGRDFVAVVVATTLAANTPKALFYTRPTVGANAGIQIQTNAGTVARCSVKDTGGPVVTVIKNNSIQIGAPFASLVRYDHDGNLSLFVNANPAPSSNAATGTSIDGAAGFGINSSPNLLLTVLYIYLCATPPLLASL
jgi:hypothetical protein